MSPNARGYQDLRVKRVHVPHAVPGLESESGALGIRSSVPSFEVRRLRGFASSTPFSPLSERFSSFGTFLLAPFLHIECNQAGGFR